MQLSARAQGVVSGVELPAFKPLATPPPAPVVKIDNPPELYICPITQEVRDSIQRTMRNSRAHPKFGKLVESTPKQQGDKNACDLGRPPFCVPPDIGI